MGTYGIFLFWYLCLSISNLLFSWDLWILRGGSPDGPVCRWGEMVWGCVSLKVLLPDSGFHCSSWLPKIDLYVGHMGVILPPAFL